jgi:ADP-ribose pyrophosphatase YjhB (NUDIX family)
MVEGVPGRLNAFDAAGRLVGSRTRTEAFLSGLAVGVVYVLLANARSEVLLQKRPKKMENGGCWDKSVGGHVDEGEDFDTTAVREAGEELFDDPCSPLVRLCPDEDAFRSSLSAEDLTRRVLFRRAGFHLNVRDVRRAPEGGLKNVLFHVAVYLGRTDVPLEGFRPQPAEIDEVGYFPAGRVDELLGRGDLAPNMGLLWLAYARPLLDLVRG